MVVTIYGPLRLDPVWERRFKRLMPKFAKWLRAHEREKKRAALLGGR